MGSQKILYQFLLVLRIPNNHQVHNRARSYLKNIFYFCLLASMAMLLVNPKLTFAAELQEIKNRGKLIVAVKDNLVPLGFKDEQGNLQGLEIDIAKKLAEELFGNGDAVVFKTVKNKDRLQVLLDDKVDLTIARLTNTPSRSRIVDFSKYYYLDGTGLITKNSDLHTSKNFSQARIAVLEDSNTVGVIKHQFPNAHLISVSSYQEALNLLEQEKADAFAADKSVLTGWIGEYPEYRQLPERLSGEPLCIVMPKGLQYQDLRSQINAAIDRWQKSGWLQERIKYWGLP